MAFPQDPLPIKAEMQINNVWTTVTTDVRNDGDIRITGGFAPEQTSLTPSSISFKLDNTGGLYSDDNPNSANYGLLPTGTPFRVGIVEATTFLRLPNGLDNEPIAYGTGGWDIGWAQTSDKAVLDVVGDLDLRIEIDPDQWQLGSAGQQLAGKYATASNQRAWAWVIQANGRMRLYWSSDGTSPLALGTYADCTAATPAGARIALRVTIDVNNGAAGRDVVFYTSDSITGTWTQLGSTVTQAGTTSIFSSSAGLTVGAIGSLAGAIALVGDPTFGYTLPLVGRVHRFQMRNGIGGTLVADMDPSTQAVGTTSWSDGLGTPNTWALADTAEITATDYRGYGEIAEMPQEWDPTGTDVFVQVQANGIVRRLTQGGQSLNSSIFRYLRQYIGAGAVGYWPLEGGSQSTAAGNVVPGQPAAVVTNVLFSADSEFPASAGVMGLVDTDSRIVGQVIGAAPTDQATLIFYHHLDSAPASDTNTVHMFTSGTARQVTFQPGSGGYRVTAYDANGVSLGTAASTFGTGAQPGQWVAVQLRVNKNGAGIDINMAWYPLGTTTAFFGIAPLNIASGVVGSHQGFATSTAISALGLNPAFAHFMALNLVGFEFANTTFSNMSLAFTGEYAAVRFLRLLREEGIEGRCVGWPQDTITMGPQLIDTLTANLADCANTSGSLMYEARDMAALIIRTYRSLVGQQAAAALTYSRSSSHLAGSFRPAISDQGLRNDVTANSPGGAFARAVKESGPRSILPPPLGSGRYDSPITVNPEDDEQLAGLAQQAVFLGTWPDRRVPNLEVWLERAVFAGNATLTRSLRSLEPGDRVTVGSVPIWVGGGTQDVQVRGYTETLMNRGHRLAFSTVPHGPYRQLTALDGSPSIRRAATAYGNARVAQAATSSATSLVVQTAEGAVFGTTASKPGNFPAGGGPTFTLNVVGEQVNCTAIAAWIADTFTRSVSSGWGSTSTGASAWTTTGGSASDFSVNGTQGVHNLSTTAVDRISALTLTARVPEVLVTHIRMPTALTGASGQCIMTIRVGTSTDYVQLNISNTTGGSMTCWLSQVVAGVETTFDSFFPATGVAATTAFSARLHIPQSAGEVAWGRVWAETAVEPDGTSTTSITLTAGNGTGDVQLRSTRNASTTNAAPFNIEFDGLTLPRNQLFTVTRSVGSPAIIKAQAAGNVVTLADEFYTART